MKNTIINFIIIILCIIALYINFFAEQYKKVGIICIVLMAVLTLLKRTRR